MTAVIVLLVAVGVCIILGTIGYGLAFVLQYLKKEYRKSKGGKL